MFCEIELTCYFMSYILVLFNGILDIYLLYWYVLNPICYNLYLINSTYSYYYILFLFYLLYYYEWHIYYTPYVLFILFYDLLYIYIIYIYYTLMIIIILYILYNSHHDLLAYILWTYTFWQQIWDKNNFE